MQDIPGGEADAGADRDRNSHGIEGQADCQNQEPDRKCAFAKVHLDHPLSLDLVIMQRKPAVRRV
ncbi:hypothetical protein SDC9_178075 [bioreactor metagenome]|uniref:Uncharacterized protein n=1 Tax=bioreactor metagenome TaxID=1076179 RepID=A0A645H2N6_9ZZZZ